jgi:hypothetical protein
MDRTCGGDAVKRTVYFEVSSAARQRPGASGAELAVVGSEACPLPRMLPAASGAARREHAHEQASTSAARIGRSMGIGRSVDATG